MNNLTPNYKTLTRIPLFRRAVLQSFPFIEEDFDALNDYELLCKVVEYLNKVIEQQNLVGENTDELLRVYLQLKEYVEHYFDNLDVQEEINNKLDDMIEQGTLQEIIADYLNSKAIFGYDNVSSMKSSTNLINGSYAQTLGYHTKNDGGKGLYKIRTITNDDVVDEMMIIALNDNTLVAELIENNIINVKQLGAYGDNTHDDLIPLQTAINNFNVVYLPIGYYYISDGLSVTKDTVIKGDSKLSIPNLGSFIRMTKENTILLNCNNSATHVELNSLGLFSSSSSVTADANLETRQTEPYNPYHYSETVENCCGILATKKLKVVNCYFTGFSGYAINCNANSIVTDVWISNSNIGIRVNGYDPIITRPYITLCKTGIKLLQGSSTSIFLYDIWIDQIVEHGIECAAITGIITGIIDHIGYSGIHASANAKINLNMRIGRCGMYYAGTDKDQLTNEQLELACGLFLTNILNSQIRYTFEYRSIGTSTGVTDYMLPKCVLGVKQYIDSIFEFIEDDTKYIGCKVINRNNSNGTIITQNGIKKWSPTDNAFVNIYQLTS